MNILQLDVAYVNVEIISNDASTCKNTHEVYKEELEVKRAMIDEYELNINEYAIVVEQLKNELRELQEKYEIIYAEVEKYMNKSTKSSSKVRNRLPGHSSLSQLDKDLLYETNVRNIIYSIKIYQTMFDIRYKQMGTYRNGLYDIEATVALYGMLNSDNINKFNQLVDKEVILNNEIHQLIKDTEKEMDADNLFESSGSDFIKTLQTKGMFQVLSDMIIELHDSVSDSNQVIMEYIKKRSLTTMQQ